MSTTDSIAKIPVDNLRWKIHGGLKLTTPSDLPSHLATMPVAKTLCLPLDQPHIGQMNAIVNVGDPVKKYQVIATAQRPHGGHIHAPSSGTVTAIRSHSLLHPSNLKVAHIVIETDGRDDPIEIDKTKVKASAQLGIAALGNLLGEYGIVGHGGGHYPSGKKLIDCHNKANHVLIINACECDPWIACDQAMMTSHPEQVVTALESMLEFIGFEQVILGIKEDMHDAITALNQAGIDKVARIKPLPNIYPIGSEKQLIRSVSGQIIGLRDHPSDIGIVVLNVATLCAIGRVLNHGIPAIERIITVAGSALAQPKNLHVRIGTPLEEIMRYCGGPQDSSDLKVTIGGRMTGFEIKHLGYHTLRNTNALLCEKPDAAKPEPVACIRCGYCQDVCPAILQPQKLLSSILAGQWDKADVDYHLFQCIECGCCDVVCPSHIPLMGYFRYAKGKMRQQTLHQRLKKKHDLANTKHTHRQQAEQEKYQDSIESSHRQIDDEDGTRQAIIARSLKSQQKDE